MEVNLLTVCTTTYNRVLNELFIPTIPKSFDSITVEHYLNDDAVPGVIDSDNFKKLSYKKMVLIHQHIKMNFNKVLIFCDIDIAIFRDFKDDILNRIVDYDILFQDNTNGTYNCGLMVFKCSEKVLNFWELIMKNYNEDNHSFMNEQFAINELIHNTDIKHNYLPKEYHCNYTEFHPTPDGGHLNNVISIIPENAILCHCILASGGENGKYQIMSGLLKHYKIL